MACKWHEGFRMPNLNYLDLHLVRSPQALLGIVCCQSINQFTFAVIEIQQGSQQTGIRNLVLKLCAMSDCLKASLPAGFSKLEQAGVQTVKQSDTVTHNFKSQIVFPNSCVLTALLSLNNSECELMD